jgi:hypothetical protein
MANAIALFSPLDRVTDDDGNPVSGALINVYAVGTTSPLDVYSDQQLTTVLPNPVVCNSVGQPTSDGSATCLVYVDTSSYKLVVTDADGALIPGMSYDAIRGADEIPTAADSGLPTTPVINKTTSYSILAADQGKLINASGASTVLTLPDAGDASVGDAWRIGVKHDDATAGRSMVVRTTGGQTITHPGQAEATSVALTGLGETMWFVSDGSDWHVDTYVPQLIHGATGIIAIADRLTAPPASPTGGACYIINGTPTGAWATLSFAEHQIARADGNGGWVAYTPVDGWLAYVGDENTYTSYQDSAWVDLTNVTAPAASALGRAIFSDTKAQNTGGGAATTGAWTKHALGTTDTNGITDAAVASDVVTLPTGKYLVVAEANFYGTAETQIRVRNTTDSTTVCVSPNRYVANYISNGASILTSETLCAVGYLDVTEETENIELQYYAANSSGSTALGRPRNVSGESEVYATLTILDLAITQGPTGAQGSQGDDGLDAAYGMIWNTATSGDPGAGKIRLDNATVASATKVAISEILPASGTLAAVLPTWDDSTSSVKGALKIGKEGAGNEDNFILVHITGTGTDYGNYWEFPITPITQSGTLINADDVAVLFIAKGDKGDPGLSGVDIPSLTTMGTGELDRANDRMIVLDVSTGSEKQLAPDTFTEPMSFEIGATTNQAAIVKLHDGSGLVNVWALPNQTTYAGTMWIGSSGSADLDNATAGLSPSNEGRYNLGLSLRCLTNLTTGSYNVMGGFESGEQFTVASWNTGWGEAVMAYHQDSIGVTAIGWKAFLGTTLSAGVRTVKGQYDTFVGYGSGLNATGTSILHNAAVGAQSLYNVQGGGTAALGFNTGYDLTTGGFHVLAGYEAGRGIVTGSYCTILGPLLNNLSSSLSNTLIIGAGYGSGNGVIRVYADDTAASLRFGAYTLFSALTNSTAPDYLTTTPDTGAVTVGAAGTSSTINLRLTPKGSAGLVRVTTQTGTIIAPIAGTKLHVIGDDGSNPRIMLDANGGAPIFNFRRAAGTLASPTALQLNNAIGSFGCIGYGATGYSAAPRINLSMSAAENWTDSAQGTYFAFETTAIGAASRAERMRITDVGNIKIGGTASRGTTEGTNQLVLFDGTAPAGTLTNGASFYSASGEMRVMDAAGNSTLLSPHDKVTNEWIYDSVDTRTGRRLRIEMERLMKALNDHLGLDLITEE